MDWSGGGAWCLVGEKTSEGESVELVWVSDDEVLAMTMELEQRDLKNRVKPLDSTSQVVTDSH